MENNLKENQETLEHKNAFMLQNELQKKKKKKTIRIVVSILLLILAIGGGIVYLIYQKAQDYKSDQIELSEEERKAAIANLFSVSAYDAIPENYKEHIYHFLEYNGYLDGTYFLTKIDDRAKNVFAFGDFTSDDNEEDDMAVLFESYDFKSSKLVIFNHKGELLYVQDYEYDLPTINSFKVGSKIYLDKLELEPAPCDGLIIKTPYRKEAIVYNKNEKKFSSYQQYTKEELEYMKNMDYNEEGDYEPDTESYILDRVIEEEPTKTNSEEEFSIQSVN